MSGASEKMLGDHKGLSVSVVGVIGEVGSLYYWLDLVTCQGEAVVSGKKRLFGALMALQSFSLSIPRWLSEIAVSVRSRVFPAPKLLHYPRPRIDNENDDENEND
jgi:hypothetical protein